MSGVAAQIIFDQPDRVFPAGDPISGQVEISVEKECSCSELTISTHFKVEGHQSHFQRGRSEIAKAADLWGPDSVYRYPFSFPAPNSPISFEATLFSIQHVLHLHAKITGEKDLNCHSVFEVIPSASQEDPSPESIHVREAPEAASKGSPLRIVVPAIASGICFLASGVVLSIPIFDRRAETTGHGMFLFLIAFLLGAVSWNAAYQWWVRQRALRLLGPLEVKITPRKLRRGKSIVVAIEFTPPRKIKIESILARLIANERTQRGKGAGEIGPMNGVTAHRQLIDQTFPLDRADELEGMERHEVETEIEIPKTALPSFTRATSELALGSTQLISAHIEWKIQIDINIREGVVWRDYFPIQVLP